MAMKFKVLTGTHDQGGVNYSAGDIIESESDLTQIFRNKFQRVEEVAQPEPEIQAEPEPEKPEIVESKPKSKRRSR